LNQALNPIRKLSEYNQNELQTLWCHGQSCSKHTFSFLKWNVSWYFSREEKGLSYESHSLQCGNWTPGTAAMNSTCFKFFPGFYFLKISQISSLFHGPHSL
jgi:hypothetical protein